MTSEQVAHNFPRTKDVFRRLKINGFSPKTIVDVGAYEGEWSYGMRELFPYAHIFMVEVNPRKMEKLNAVAAQVGNAEVCMAACSFTAEDRDFYILDSGSSFYEEQTTFPRGKTTVPTERLDVIYPKPCDLLKIDVQGAELDVLKGYKFTSDVQMILLETSLLEYNSGAPDFCDVVGEMARHYGFVPYEFCEEFRREDGTLFQIDTIFVPYDSPLRAKKKFWSNEP